MKNLFSIRKSHGEYSSEFDEVPFPVVKVSDRVRDQMKDSFAFVDKEFAPHAPTDEEKALKKKAARYWALCLVCLVAAFFLFFAGNRTGLYTAMPYLHVLDLGCLIGSLVFNFKARKIAGKQADAGHERAQIDFSEATKQLQKAAAEAAKELDVPDTALSVDILPFHYILKNGEVKPAGKRGHFENLSMSVFLRDGDLCLATAQELFRIPLTDIRGYREYDEDFELDMWLKPEESDSDAYKDYGIRKSGVLGRRGHGYFGVDIRGEFEIRIPCYDFPRVRELLHLSRLS